MTSSSSRSREIKGDKKARLIGYGFLLWMLGALPARAQGTLRVVFRYDDFAGDQPGVREQDSLRRAIWDAERGMDSLFAARDMPYVIAIIPHATAGFGGVGQGGHAVSFGEDTEKAEFIRNVLHAGRVEVAQHGYSHRNWAGKNHKSGEFRERSFADQRQDLGRGREILLDACQLCEVRTFVPPWNGWDDNTGRALRELGFQVLSGDRYYYYESARDLTIIPYTVVPDELAGMLSEGAYPQGGVIVVCLHPYEIVEFPAAFQRYYFGLERLEQVLTRLAGVPDVKVVTFQQLLQEEPQLSTDRFRAANQLWQQRVFWSRLLPGHWQPGTGSKGLYLSQADYSSKVWFWRMAALALILAVMLLGFLVRRLCVRRLGHAQAFAMDLLASSLLVIALLGEARLVERGYQMTALRAIPAFFSIPFVAGLVQRGAESVRRGPARTGRQRGGPDAPGGTV